MELNTHTDNYLGELMLNTWSNDSPPRKYLGGSEIGHVCIRYLWLKYHGYFRENFKGRILRLFNRGHREEDVFISELRKLGVDVVGEQYEVTACNGKFKGHIDGVGLNIPNQTKPHLLEFKTMNTSNFKDLQKKGVKASKPQYYAQMQVYMYLCKLDRAFFIAVNKNNDEIYTTRVKLKKREAKDLLERANMIINSSIAPEKICNKPTYYICVMCSAFDVCHDFDDSIPF